MTFWNSFSGYAYQVQNGSRSFGGSIWWNSERIGIEVSIWNWELQLTKEFRWKR